MAAAVALAVVLAVPAVLAVVVVAVGLGIIGQAAAGQGLRRRVGQAGDAAEDADAAHGERVDRAGPDAAADKGVDALLREEDGQGLVPRAGGVDNLAGEDLAVLYRIDLEALGVPEVLEYRVDGLNIAETMDLTVRQASRRFAGTVVEEKLRPLMQVGLVYLHLNQALSTLSGGELQRLKLASYLPPASAGEKGAGKQGNAPKRIFILDEPTDGLHAKDIQNLVALLEGCGLADKPVTAENISFALAPRLNAAGRMESAAAALQLLLCEDFEKAQDLTARLCQANADRQAAEQSILSEAEAQIAADPSRLRDRVLLVWGDGFHPGVIGIVASRLVEKYGKPTLVISVQNGEGKGSGRSVPGFNLHGAISACAPVLIRFGGHAMAAGLSVKEENIPALRRAINDYAAKEYPVLETPPLRLDAAVRLETLTVQVQRTGLAVPDEP